LSKKGWCGCSRREKELKMFHRAIFGWLAAIGMGHFAAGLCLGQQPAVNPSIATSRDSAPFSLDSYRQRIERMLPKGWSIETKGDELFVAMGEKVLVGHNSANPTHRPDPPAMSVDDHVYLPGKGDPKKMIYIDQPGVAAANSDTPYGPMQPMPYRLFEPTPGQPAPETCSDVWFGHQPYVITLRFRPLVSSEEYRRLIDANRSMTAKIEEIRKQLRSRRLTTKFDDFLPNTPEDKKLIEEFKRLKRSIQPLPRFHDENRTVDIRDSLDKWSSAFFANGRIAKQVESIRSQIERLFVQYPPAD
jgi:hypothetical protein